MLRVLNLSAPTGLAGAERVMLNYLQNHDAGSFTVRVASYLNYRHQDNPFTEAVENLGIPHDKIRIGDNGLTSQIYATYRVIKRHKIDVLHTHGYCSDFIGLIAARLARISIVSTVHGWTAMTPRQHKFEALDRFCLKRFDGVICVSTPLHLEFSRLGLGPERLFYRPNAVNLPELLPGRRDQARQRLGLAPDGKLVIAIGRLSPEKGLEVLLAAYARQFASRRDVRLILVGDGPEMARLKSLAEALGIAERVDFAGFTADVEQYYAAADLFVMSSHSEGFPMALLEAMAWGLPVLASAVGGIPDIVRDGENGCLVPPGDEGLLGGAMAKLLEDRPAARSMGEQARQTIAERFSAEGWARTIEKVYATAHQKRVRS